VQVAYARVEACGREYEEEFMRAIGISRYGNASVLELWELPVPQPGAGEALVKVRFAALISWMSTRDRVSTLLRGRIASRCQ
jgi:hypothetical protein